MKLKRAAVVFPNKRRSALGRATQSEETGSSKGISELWKIALCDMFCIFMNGGIGKVMEKTVWSSSQPAVAALAPSPAFLRPFPSLPPFPPYPSPLLPAAEQQPRWRPSEERVRRVL